MTSDGYSEDALGDSGSWVCHLPLAWRAVADPEGRHPAPPQVRSGDLAGHDRIASWGPFLHIVGYGLGWPRPDLGLARWWAAGRPTDDDRLSLIDRWWGDAVVEVLEWALVSQAMRNFCDTVCSVTGTTTSTDPPSAFGIGAPEIPDGRRRWGQGDPMHLWSHALSPIADTSTGDIVVGEHPTGTRPGRAVLFLDRYAGWYAELHRLGAELPVALGHRSWQIDVVCRPLGWLGCYRRSRVSGRWFAGQHRWHQLGIP